MTFSKPFAEIVRARYSCRTYQERPIDAGTRQALAAIAASLPPGPFGTSPRFQLVAATAEDRDALKGLGTYGFIKGATGFLVGATGDPARGTEDYGYLMELLVLHATDLGLGTCWLGGSFTKSSFAAKIDARPGELVPAVAAVGHIAGRPRAFDPLIRRFAQSDKRLPWQRLFFREAFDRPLSHADAGAYALPLEMVRLGPSASNKQPWRIIRDGDSWHFYLARTRGYGAGRLTKGFLTADMQRLDMGIAMCHFALAARALGLQGHWSFAEPPIDPGELTEYTATWAG